LVIPLALKISENYSFFDKNKKALTVRIQDMHPLQRCDVGLIWDQRKTILSGFRELLNVLNIRIVLGIKSYRLVDQSRCLWFSTNWDTNCSIK